MSTALPVRDLDPAAPARRFGFLGRVSTEDNQDPAASYNWQKSRSRALIESAGGVIVADYFDIGQSRSLPWKRRPRAAQLLADLADPGRGYDAVVIGEPQRAFYGELDPVLRVLRTPDARPVQQPGSPLPVPLPQAIRPGQPRPPPRQRLPREADLLPAIDRWLLVIFARTASSRPSARCKQT